MRRTGTADLPLHHGKAPRWLFDRMVNLAGGIAEILVYEYGQEEFLRRLSDPCWFQAFSCVLGFDWHSSGVTTTTCGALKMAIKPELGIKVCGGKGSTSRKTPEEIDDSAEFSLSSEKLENLIYASKMSAKVDNSCVQDDYRLYHHCFFFSEKGSWAVVQQGMRGSYARRYHWLSEDVKSFVEEPHSGICCDRTEEKVLNMTAHGSEDARKVSLDLIKDDPAHLERYLRMPEHHPLLDMDLRAQDRTVLQRAYEIQPESYEELIALRGMGPKKIRALALISELIFGASPSWRDPAKFSFAHGGKDGFPYPVNRETYDGSIKNLRDAIEQAKLDRKEKYFAMKRLNEFL